ncbi:MAG: NYN domain-containing protein [Flavobacteriaceae bacterium]|nr:NYN domain-containing protein [Flavobacteriaceae bacterium]
MRTIFYVDGFNFYYGLRNQVRDNPVWRSAYWIDIVKLFEQFLGPNDELIKVKYFTAAPLSIGKRSRQSALFKANDLINGDRFEIIRGKYIDKDIKCKNCKTYFTKPEEKRTDVNIAVHLIGDCALNNVDKLVLVSADSDLVPPLEFIKNHYPAKSIKVYFPPSNFSNDLKNTTLRKKVTLLGNNLRKFQNAQMLHNVVKSDGSDSALIPAKWIV